VLVRERQEVQALPRRVSRSRAAELAIAVGICFAVAGCGGILGGEAEPPDPMATELVSARAAATDAADAALADAATALGGRVVARTSADACYEGQNNWKVHDGYEHRCTLRRAAVVAFDGDFRKRIARFDERLFASGWGCYGAPCEETLSGKVEEYWGYRKAENGGEDPPITRLPTTIMYDTDGLYLDVQYAGADLTGRQWLKGWHRRRRGGLFTSFERSQPLDVDAVLRRSAPHDFVVALAIETDYFEA
jgi:hypothetical protein